MQVGRCVRGRRPLLRLLSSWVALHTALSLSEHPVCCPSAGMKDGVLTRLPGGKTVGAPDRPPALSFPFLSASCLPGSLGNATWGKQVPTYRTKASGMRPEFGPREMGQSHFQERAQYMDPFLGEAASRPPSATITCWSQWECGQWLEAGSEGASAASSLVGLSLSATTWYGLPMGGWQQWGPGVSDRSRRGRE